MIASAECSHANPTLERLLSRVNPDVSGQLVTPGESPVAVRHRASVGSLVDGRFAGAVRIFPRSHRHQSNR